MYNMTLTEFGQLIKEYNEIEEIKYSALRQKQRGGVNEAQETLKDYTERREKFVNKFQLQGRLANGNAADC